MAEMTEKCIVGGILSDFFMEYKDMIISNDAIDLTMEKREEWARLEGVDMTLKYLEDLGLLTGEIAKEARKAISKDR